jgi:hypothetical protein
MKKSYLFLAATAIIALAACSDNTYVGDNEGNTGGATGAISFGGGFKAITRAGGAEAATALNNQFIVGGYKGDGSAMVEVFDNYIVNYTANTAATTESNTANWEYVGVTAAAPSAVTGTQTIKYWDYAVDQYDFAAYSVGNKTRVTTTPTTGQVKVTAIAPHATYASNGLTYSLTGAKDDLAACYISNMTTAYNPGDFRNEVDLTFRSLAAKVRVALYETVPGYSVKDVKFYASNSTPAFTGTVGYVAPTTTATLIGSFKTGGTYTVNFPTIGSSNTSNADYNKAHVTVSDGTYDPATTQTFSTLNYVAQERSETTGTIYLARSSATPSFAGTGDYYQTVLPDETGNLLELRVDYTLVPVDGADETIVVRGATAFIPSAFTKWNPNYAYTYIFKISDNTNGTTGIISGKPSGLYPITFDAVVADTQTGSETITTVSTPSITTYQKGSNVTSDNEYSASGKDIYVVVENDGSGVVTLTSANAKLYTATVEDGAVQGITEMSVDNAIANGVYATGTPNTFTVTDANAKDLVVSESDLLSTVTEIDATDSPTGVAITINGVKFTPVAGKTYVFQYQITAPVYDSGTVLDASTSLKGYYTDAAGVKTRCADSAVADGSTTYYKVTTPGVYQYKVIKVKAAP